MKYIFAKLKKDIFEKQYNHFCFRQIFILLNLLLILFPQSTTVKNSIELNLNDNNITYILQGNGTQNFISSEFHFQELMI